MITCRDVYNLRLDGVELLTGEIGLDFSKPYRVGIIVIDRKYGVNLEQNEHTYEYYTDCLNREVIHMKKKPMYMRFLNKFVLLFEATETKETEHELEAVLTELDNRPQFRNLIRGTCILGNTYTNPSDFGKSYQEAKSLIPKKDILPNPRHKKVLSASSMGIYKFMFNSGNQQEILDYCNDRLRKLEEYDHANGTYLQETLVAYYMNRFNKGSAYENVKKLSELAGTGCKVTTQLGTGWVPLLDQIEGAELSGNYETTSECFMAISNGVADVCVVDLPTAESAALTNKDLVIITFDENDTFVGDDEMVNVCIATRKDDTELRDRIQEAMNAIGWNDKTKMDALMDQVISQQPAAN